MYCSTYCSKILINILYIKNTNKDDNFYIKILIRLTVYYASIIGLPLGPAPGDPGGFVSNINRNPTNTPGYGKLSISQN